MTTPNMPPLILHPDHPSSDVLLFDQKHLFFRPDLKLPQLPRVDIVKDRRRAAQAEATAQWRVSVLDDIEHGSTLVQVEVTIPTAQVMTHQKSNE